MQVVGLIHKLLSRHRLLIIDTYDSLKIILLRVFKVSIQQGIFPDSLK